VTGQLILVTGAAGGQQGRTGRHVCEMLLARGIPVRAFVHRLDERSDRLRGIGAKLFEGDLLDFASVQRAVKGVTSIYFAYPVQEGLLDATVTMAAAARQVRISRLVDLVMLQSSPEAPTPRMRQNYLSEQVFEWAGIGAAHVRAAVFYENLRALLHAGLSAEDSVHLPFDDVTAVLPAVAAEDVARVAVGLLTSPRPPAGASYRVIGAVLSVRDIIASFAAVVGRSIRFEAISDEEWRHAAFARGVNSHAVEHLSHLWRYFRSTDLDPNSPRYSIPDTIEVVGGRKPKTFEAFLCDE
jgi:uncharacterized protein YbjT (DUF2867 family)